MLTLLSRWSASVSDQSNSAWYSLTSSGVVGGTTGLGRFGSANRNIATSARRVTKEGRRSKMKKKSAKEQTGDPTSTTPGITIACDKKKKNDERKMRKNFGQRMDDQEASKQLKRGR